MSKSIYTNNKKISPIRRSDATLCCYRLTAYEYGLYQFHKSIPQIYDV